ncbi:hypothetical protein ON010_g13938 [Phytophthora cinnamomi]|nr:hypothetical protein ON010_g13938 [Phytophthora cinnamomi]
MEGVRKVADTGRTVVCTIHQPSSEVFSVFDSLLLLKRGGETVFAGDLGNNASEMIAYFESIDGVDKLKDNYNPATWMLEVIGAGVGNSNGDTTDFVRIFQASRHSELLQSNLDREGVSYPSPLMPPLEYGDKRAATEFIQAKFLLQRFFNMFWRTASYNLTRFGLMLMLGLIFGITYISAEYSSYAGINSGMGMLFCTTGFIGFVGFISVVPIASTDRLVFYRERASQSYNALWYFVGSTVVEVPYVFFGTLLFMVPFYPMVGFTGVATFFAYWFHLSLHVLWQAYFGQLMSYLMPSVEVAQVCGILMQMIFLTFNGFNPPGGSIPLGYVWLYRITPHRYALGIAASIAFGDCPSDGDGSNIGCHAMTGLPPSLPDNMMVQEYLEVVFNVKHSEIWENLSFTVGFIVLYRLLGLLALRLWSFTHYTVDKHVVPGARVQRVAGGGAGLPGRVPGRGGSAPAAAPDVILPCGQEDENTFAPPTQTALTNGTPSQLLVESNTLSVQETTIVPVASSKTQPKNSRKKKKLNYDPNKARNERRFELACLRKEAKDLQLTLEQLQSMQDSDERSTSVKRPRQLVPRARASSGMSAVWEQICAHQLERRLRVERENIHLKMMYKSQVQVAKSIEKLLQKRLALQDSTYSEVSKHTSRIEVPQGYNTEADQKIFEELSTGVEVSYQEVESVFDEHDPGRTQLPTKEPLLRDSVNGKYMELFDNKIMPFDMRSTGDAWWRRWHNYKGHCAHENGPNNTIVEKFGLEMKDVKTRTTATFYVQQILRRHVEEGRVVIVWHAHIKPLEFEKKAANGVHYLEKGYVLMKPHITDTPMESDEAATRVMTCYIITPHLSNRKLRTDARTTALTDFVLSATSANICMSNEMIENLLVDRAMKKGATG